MWEPPAGARRPGALATFCPHFRGLLRRVRRRRQKLVAGRLWFPRCRLAFPHVRPTPVLPKGQAGPGARARGALGSWGATPREPSHSSGLLGQAASQADPPHVPPGHPGLVLEPLGWTRVQAWRVGGVAGPCKPFSQVWCCNPELRGPRVSRLPLPVATRKESPSFLLSKKGGGVEPAPWAQTPGASPALHPPAGGGGGTPRLLASPELPPKRPRPSGL